MLAVLLFQAASFLPPADEIVLSEAPQSVAYLETVQTAATQEFVEKEEARQLIPQDSPQTNALRYLLRHGNVAEVRLVAILSANSSRESPLTLALPRAACSIPDEAAALACLLAPQAAPASSLPSLAFLAQDASAPLALRSAATGLLLESGLLNAWPLARSILLSGTADDAHAPWATWPRTGRYELAKRILLLAIQRTLLRAERPPSDYEPNAAWEAQSKQVAALEAQLKTLPWLQLAESHTLKSDTSFQRAAARLLDAHAKSPNASSDEQSAILRALGMLAPHTHQVLLAALQSNNPARIRSAQLAAQYAPR